MTCVNTMNIISWTIWIICFIMSFSWRYLMDSLIFRKNIVVSVTFKKHDQIARTFTI
ncbi:unnamed protein product [Schistosoma mattheei]|uniref:Uncharacterized protein n=1 Tax=Schistosoma mattheei TaxID=31246 RepID=A0A3P8C381_9TREM|nr:unnamed protein product [Schistosoma mattheei]